MEVEEAESHGILMGATRGAPTKSTAEHEQLKTAVRLGADARNAGMTAAAVADEQPPTIDTQSQMSPLPRLLRAFCSAIDSIRARDSTMPASLKNTPSVKTRAVGIVDQGQSVRRDLETLWLNAADAVAGNKVDSSTGDTVQTEPGETPDRLRAPTHRTAQPNDVACRVSVQLSNRNIPYDDHRRNPSPLNSIGPVIPMYGDAALLAARTVSAPAAAPKSVVQVLGITANRVEGKHTETDVGSEVLVTAAVAS